MALTEDEHIARAMLLGLVYDKVCHTYYGRAAGSTWDQDFDPDTLEHIPQRIVSQRYADKMREGITDEPDPEE